MANFIPPANGASQGNYILPKSHKLAFFEGKQIFGQYVAVLALGLGPASHFSGKYKFSGTIMLPKMSKKISVHSVLPVLR